MAPRSNGPAPEWTTALTSIEADRILVRGYPVDELMGRVYFGDAVYLLLTGELPSPAISRLIGAMLTGFIDHGVTPTSIIARHSMRAGASLPGSVAAGLLAFDKQHTNGVAECRALLEECLEMSGSSMLVVSAASELVEGLVQADRIPPPGFGQAKHVTDPRVTRLLQIALELEVDALYSQCLRAIEVALSRHPALVDEPLPVNVNGALAAVCGDLGLSSSLAEALLVISRVPGLIAHALEEKARLDPTSAPPSSHYTGPSERRLRDRR
jgi:citrate synthase